MMQFLLASLNGCSEQPCMQCAYNLGTLRPELFRAGGREQAPPVTPPTDTQPQQSHPAACCLHLASQAPLERWRGG